MGTRVAAGQAVTASELNATYTDSDPNNNTSSSTSFAGISTTYTIAANDAAVGTIYRITCWGTGTWGATQQKLTLGIALAGTVLTPQPIIASTALAASAAFSWRAVIELQCISTGATGTWSASISGVITQTANNILPGTAADNTIPFTGNTGTSDVTQDTTASISVALQALWASVIGGPTITGVSTYRERLD
jgi:hypothetical protein